MVGTRIQERRLGSFSGGATPSYFRPIERAHIYSLIMALLSICISYCIEWLHFIQCVLELIFHPAAARSLITAEPPTTTPLEPKYNIIMDPQWGS